MEVFSSTDATGGDSIVHVYVFPDANAVDKFNPDQWDIENHCVIPEAAWEMSLVQARQLAGLLIEAAGTSLTLQPSEES